MAALARLWALSGVEFDDGWRQVRDRAVETLQLGRAAAIHAAIPYTSTVLAETGQSGPATGAIVPAGFMQAAPNGMPVEDTLDRLPVVAKQRVAGGMTALEARSSAGAWLSGVALTMLSDTKRDVFQADMIARPRVTGYVRMVSPGACDRCIILAGKRFLWNQGFERHPLCNCQHIPAAENVAGDLTTDPYAYFNSLSEKQQNRVFGKAQAQAIRDGADIYRVTNIRMRGLGTAASNQRYGTPYRRTVEDIYKHDRDRRFVIENLRYHGYITGPQTPGGNIIGNDPAARILAAGRGRGTYTVGGQRVVTARAARYDAVTSGRRDPLNRATMTAAERRLYDAHYRAQWAAAGYRPNTVGANSADRGLGLRPITPREAAAAREALQRQLAGLSAPGTPASVHRLAELLGF